MNEPNCLEIINTVINGSTFVSALAIAIIEGRRLSRINKDNTANKISSWLQASVKDGKESYMRVAISNSSNIPIYDVFVSVDIMGGFSPVGTGYDVCSYIACVPSGSYIVEVPFSGGCAGATFAPSVTFRDEYNQVWTRRSDGRLEKHKKYWLHDRSLLPRRVNETTFSVRKCDPPIESKTIEAL